MRRKRKARLKGIARSVWFGRQEDIRRYWCLSIGFVWRSVWIWLLLRWTCTSRKGSDWLEVLEYSPVNLTVGWMEFRYWMKALRWSSPSVQIIKTSSMNLHQTKGLWGAFSMACCSSLPMKRFAYEGAMRVPIAVPWICRKCWLLKVKLFMLRIIWMRSQSRSVGRDLLLRVLRKWRQASRPSLWGKLVNNEETSRVTRIALLGRGPSFSSSRRKWVVSLKYEGSDCTRGFRW